MSRQVRKVARGDHGEMPAVPITVRQLEAIVRISESLARMQLQPVATEAHVREAIDLFKISTMDAVKSGAPQIPDLCTASRIHRCAPTLLPRCLHVQLPARTSLNMHAGWHSDVNCTQFT